MAIHRKSPTQYPIFQGGSPHADTHRLLLLQLRLRPPLHACHLRWCRASTDHALILIGSKTCRYRGIQHCYTNTSYPLYAYSGTDQAITVTTMNATYYKFGGKLFQKQSGRSLKTAIHAHESVGSWVNNFTTMTVRPSATTPNGVNRTYTTGFTGETGTPSYDGLLSSALLSAPVERFSMSSGSPGDVVSLATLHNLMSSQRDYSASNLQDVTVWKVDLYICDWILLVDGVRPQGVMFDADVGSITPDNNIAREAAAVLFPRIEQVAADDSIYYDPYNNIYNQWTHPGVSDALYAQRSTVRIGIHELGHALNMTHSWSSWHTAGGDYRGIGSSSEGSIMSYARHNAILREKVGNDPWQEYQQYCTMRFNEETNRDLVTWYREGPESWVKPGRYGYDFVVDYTTVPSYNDY